MNFFLKYPPNNPDNFAPIKFTLLPWKIFLIEFNFIEYQKEGKEGFEKDTDDYWKQTTFFETGEMKVKTKAQRSMFEIVKKSVYCLSAFIKANCLF